MIDVLRIDGSIRREGSRSSLLADHLIERLGSHRLIERQVGIEPPTAPTEAFMMANHTDPVSRFDDQVAVLAESDRLIDEFLGADLVVVATSM